jgi:hypothetical protein
MSTDLHSVESTSNLSLLDSSEDGCATLSVSRGGGGGGGGSGSGGGGGSSAPSHGGVEACRAERLHRMAAAVRELIECMGEDSSREGLLQTPARSAKALLALTEGYTRVRGAARALSCFRPLPTRP